MRVGIFGNTNNVSLALALSLRASGADVRLVINRKEHLHRPESRYSEFEGRYPGWMLDCSDLSLEDFVAGHLQVNTVINFLANGRDWLILNDIGPSLYEYCNLPAIALLTGSDITFSANYNTVDNHRSSYHSSYLDSPGENFFSQAWRNFITRQRYGIASSVCVHAAAPGLVPEIDAILSELGVNSARRISNYISHAIGSEAERTVANTRFRVLNGSRLNWVKPLPDGFCSMDDKGTDILIRGFKEFLDKGYDAELVLIRKGLHISETEALINDCGIANHVVWLDELSMQEFYQEIIQSDVVCDQFGPATPGLVAMDAMAMGRPVVASFNLPILEKCYPEIGFVCDAQTPSAIAGHLARLNDSIHERTNLAKLSRDFIRKFCSPDAVAKLYMDKMTG